MKDTNEVPILNWRPLDENDQLEISNVFGIIKDYEILYSDILGDLIVKKDNQLYSVDHEEPNEPYYKIIDDYESFKIILVKLEEIDDDFDENTDLKTLKETKKTLQALKKIGPKYLVEQLEETIDELKEYISDYKFYQTDEGKFHLETNKFSELFYKAINKPNKYKEIYVYRLLNKNSIIVQGALSEEDETIDELNKALENLKDNFKSEISLDKILTYKEYIEDLNTGHN